MFYRETRIRQGLSYISFCPLRILYNSKFILMATSLGTNAVVVTRVHYISFFIRIALASRCHIGITFHQQHWHCRCWRQQCEVCVFSSVSQTPRLLANKTSYTHPPGCTLPTAIDLYWPWPTLHAWLNNVKAVHLAPFLEHHQQSRHSHSANFLSFLPEEVPRSILLEFYHQESTSDYTTFFYRQ